MTSKPRIGITGPDKGGSAAWFFTAWAVRRVGGRPVRIRPAKPRSIEAIDGLIIGGGADVAPQLYGQEKMPELGEFEDRGVSGWRRLLGLILFPLLLLIRRLLTTKTTGLNAARDALEKELIAQAAARNMPMLGICRGMQLLNVVGGGSLHQSLANFYEETPAIRSVLPRKRIEIEPDSLLARTLLSTGARVNALHSQAIDKLGDSFTVCAREPSGVVQAIERTDHPFVLGVQWHPEYLPQRIEQRALFRHLVQAAAEIKS
ncbi:MAG: gamma-glutamyl-gamma-aminobutyrate hydrolase family protein [Wenzhouxiangella sp.]|nr:MAG: gamma-glutamyl-gamma-aminobutyrate hydrolase family protein [Wenzhouxiangella sp.]